MGVGEQVTEELELMLLLKAAGRAGNGDSEAIGRRLAPLLQGSPDSSDQRVLVATSDQTPTPDPFDTLVSVAVEDEHQARNLAQAIRAKLGDSRDGATDLHALLVRSRWPKPRVQRPESGSRADAGVVMVSAMHRIAEPTHEQFDHHWRDRHAPLALEHHPGMAAYQQNVVEQVLTPNSPAWDGVAVLYFDSPDDLANRLYNDEESQRIIMDDVARFVDLERSTTVIMTDNVAAYARPGAS
ncbi:MAG: EthD domain-containing protein [Deltaproteobacteria bacterium]|nr:EthD domain-containing protein [Deltaproteobacteria bacterium]